MSSRTNILKRIASAQRHAGGDMSLHETSNSTSPHNTPASAPETWDTLKTQLKDNGIAVRQCPGANDLPACIAELVEGTSPRQRRVRIAPHTVFQKLKWDQVSTLNVHFGSWQTGDTVALSYGTLAVAESGSLIVTSGEDSPTGLAFLPEVHIIALHARAVVATLEDAMTSFSNWTQGGRDSLPRAINIISGASRTADIGGKIVHGAHGPGKLCVVIYG